MNPKLPKIFVLWSCLSSFPRNVKALFRRALALMKLKKFLEARSDLENALLVEPKNKDILREFDVVKNHLIINSNGKRSTEILLEHDEIREGKIPLYTLEPPIPQTTYKGGCVVIDSCSSSIISAKSDDGSNFKSDSIHLPTPYNIDMELDSKLDHSSVGNKMLHFSKRGKGCSQLRIPMHTYQKLLQGEQVSFYQNAQMSVMKVRILKPTNLHSEKNFKPTNLQSEENIGTTDKKKRKKKRRRRHSKNKGEIKGNAAIEEVVHSSLTTSRETSSGSDLEAKIIAPDSTSMLVEETTNQRHLIQPFIFSSQQKFWRIYRVKRLHARSIACLEVSQSHLLVQSPKISTSSSRTSRRSHLFKRFHHNSFVHQHKITNSSTCFPCKWKTNFPPLRPCGVSLHYSGDLNNIKRKSYCNLALMETSTFFI